MKHFIGGNKFSKIDEIEEEVFDGHYHGNKPHMHGVKYSSGLASRTSEKEDH